MKRDLAQFDKMFDLLVIGGGIFGASAALDAAQRGLSVALIERGDFCSATSANSYKLLHGGMRYLQHADLRRVRLSAQARHTFIRIAPHLAKPLPIAVPTYGHGMKSKLAMRLAMAVYDTVTFDRNRDIPDPTRQVPPGICLTRNQTLAQYPGLDPAGLTGAAVFCDGQMINPPRIVFAFVQAAQQQGAAVANYLQATGFKTERGRITHVAARDQLTGDTLTLRAKLILNAAGPYAEPLVASALAAPIEPPTYWSRDAFFVIHRPLVPGPRALALQARTHDPEALLSRGARHLFLVPWHQHTLVGVWHKVYQGHPDHYSLDEEELQTFLNEINAAYQGLNLCLDDISLTNAGLIPFGENDPNAKNLKFAHRSRLIDHTDTHHIHNLLTLIGVRYTTGPIDAAQAVTLALHKLGKTAVPSTLHHTPLPGGDIENFQQLLDEACRAHPYIPPLALQNLLHNHGCDYRRVLALAKDNPDLAQPIEHATTLKAEMLYAAQHEMAPKLLDLVVRRTDLGTGNYPGRAAIEIAAKLAASAHHWSDQQTRDQIDHTLAAFAPFIRRRRDNAANFHPSQRACAPNP